jgi:hypothetical protein
MAGRKVFATFFSIASALLLLLCCHAAFGQAGGKGTIQGTVTDPSGAIVPGAEVTATLVATGETVTQKTTSAGFYALASLKPGVYTIKVNAAGFQAYVQENVTLDALQVFGLNAQLHVGSTNESVTISAAPPPIDTTNATLGNTMENESYQALPLNMSGAPRDPTAFVFLTAGVASSAAPYGSFNGGQGYHNEDYIEGLAVTNAAAAGGGNTAPISRGASVDAVDQFQVQTTGTSAAYQGQGVENYTLKSGTNTFHGRAFEYFRNTVLDTWGYFSKAQIDPATGVAAKPVERQNEFGGTFGGPILHDKLFFFFSYDGQRYLRGANPSFVSVPTLAQRNGDFSAAGNQPIYDPATTTCNASGSVCTRTQFVSDGSNGIAAGTKNVIPKSRFSPQMLYYQNFIPLPVNNNLTNNYLAGFNTGFTYYKYSIKVDYDLTKRNRITLLFLTGNRAALPACCDSSGLPPPFTATVGNFQTYPTGVIEDTFTINDHWINQFKYGVVRSSGYSTNPAEGLPAYAATAAGITNILPGQASMAAPRMGFSGNIPPASLGGTANSNNQANSEYGDSFVLYDTMQYVRGRHSMSFGGQYEWLEDNDTALTTGTYLNLNYTTNETANFLPNSVTTATTSGAGYASYLLGAIDNYAQTDNRAVLTTGARFYAFSPFFQDDFKATERLTLNLGLRWDLYSPFREVQNRLSFLDTQTINPVTGTPGVLTFAGSGPGTCNCTRASKIPYKNFGPHVGFAYSATPKTVFRGSFSIAFAHDGGVGGRGGARQGASQEGFTSSNNFPSPDGYSPALYLNSANSALNNVTLPTPTASFGTGYTTAPGFTAAGQGITYVDPYLATRAPYYENFNLGVQREILNQTTINVDYSGSNGRFLPTGMGNGPNSGQLDPAYYVLGPLLSAKASPANIAAAQAILPSYKLPFANFGPSYTIGQSLRPFPQYNGITDIYGDFGMSSYNSLQVVAKQRPRGGLSYTFNYTFSKLIDNTGTGRSAYNHQYDRSLSLYDHPHNISAYAVYAEPFGKGPGFADKLIRNFEVSGIYTFTSGTPLAILGTGCVTVLAGTCEPYINPAYSGNARINGNWGRGSTAAGLSSVPFIDANAFASQHTVQTTDAYTFGNASRTAPFGLRGPGGYNVDMSLRRSFGIFERLKLMMEVDAFNVTNHTRFANPNVTLANANYSTTAPYAPLGTGAFGTVTSTANSSRDIQLVGRIDF